MNKEIESFRKARPQDGHLPPTRSAFIDGLIEQSIHQDIQRRKLYIRASTAFLVVALIGLMFGFNNSQRAVRQVKDMPPSTLISNTTTSIQLTSGNVERAEWEIFVSELSKFTSDRKCISREEMEAWIGAADKKFHSLLSSSISWNSYSPSACLKAKVESSKKWQISISE